jgi:hypothetical protein
MRTSGRPARTSGCSMRTSGRPRDSWGRRAKARAGCARSQAILAQFSPCPIHFGSRAANTRSAPGQAKRPFARISGRRRYDSRRPTKRRRRPE